MSLQVTTQLNVDFSTQKYICLNAKQYDKMSRFILVKCYNQGKIFPISSGEHAAFIRYRKPDSLSVFNTCEIVRTGEILIELTEQMLATDGIAYADLVIVNKGMAEVDTDTGEIVYIDNSAILSTMTFCIDVFETAVENSEIESSYEFDHLNKLLEESKANFKKVILTAKSYAEGDAEGIRENEDTENAKYYYEQSIKNAKNAYESEVKAKESEVNAKISETNAKTSETNAGISEINAKTSEINALSSETNAKTSELNAKNFEINAKDSEIASADYSEWSKSYALGGTGLRENEDTENSQYYHEQLRRYYNGTSNTFIPMGTITFEELATAEKYAGYFYNISNDFITDDTFAEGAGNTYEAGTYVYYTYDGKWDVLVGMTVSIANLDEAKEYLGI